LATTDIRNNREALQFEYKQVAERLRRENKDDVTSEFLEELVPELIDLVPAAAFDDIQPVDEGILFYHGSVDENEVVDFQHDLMRAHLNLSDGIPITLNLSSVGGSVFAGLALISTIYDIQRAGRKVNVHVQGVAMSMGSVIAQVADRRTIEPSAFFMLHEVSYAMRGSTADHEEEREFSTKLQDALYQHYSARTGKPVSYYQGKLKKRNWYLTAQEALDEKLVDEIIEAPFYAHSAVKHVPKPPKRPTTRKSNKEVVA
jgi:ATP-dependent protease ClpP protease subunit